MRWSRPVRETLFPTFHYSRFLVSFLSSRGRGRKDDREKKKKEPFSRRDKGRAWWYLAVMNKWILKYREQVSTSIPREFRKRHTWRVQRRNIYIVYANLCSLRSRCVEGMALAIQMKLLPVGYSGIMWLLTKGILDPLRVYPARQILQKISDKIQGSLIQKSLSTKVNELI